MSWWIAHGPRSGAIPGAMLAASVVQTHTALASHGVIAGVNKAGTTSLFAMLSGHPAIAPSAVKETRYFLPARYGQPLAACSVYDAYFDGTPHSAVRMEATPSYFYGGHQVAERIAQTLPTPKIIVMLREPVSRAVSFFQYQKARLRLPLDLEFSAYLATADRLGPADFSDPENEKYMAFRGGRYADFLAGWLDVFGTERLRVVSFERFVASPGPVAADLARWLGIDPGGLTADEPVRENATTAFKSLTFQRLALLGNDRFERSLRRHQAVKRTLRALYYKLNGRTANETIPVTARADLAERYREPNERLAAQLQAASIELPAWLSC